MATTEELEERIRKLEERVSLQDEAIKSIYEFVQNAVDDQFEKRRAYSRQKREEEEHIRKEAKDRTEKIKTRMKKLGYPTSEK